MPGCRPILPAGMHRLARIQVSAMHITHRSRLFNT
jgi:hypothetical protein